MSAVFDIEQLQPFACDRLRRSVQTGRIAGTYLVSGRELYGQFPLAFWFAALANCQASAEPDLLGQIAPRPCRICSNCREIAGISSPLVQVLVPIQAAKNESEALDLTITALAARRSNPFGSSTSAKSQSISIDAIRSVRSALAYRPRSLERRLVIIDQIERTLPAALDALLKLIEEPPPQTTFFLLTSAVDVLAATIRSRSQQIVLPPVRPPQLAHFLVAHVKTDPQRAELVARQASGSLGEAITLLSESSEFPAAALEIATTFHRSLLEARSPASLLPIADLIGDNGAQFGRVLLHWQRVLCDHQRYAQTGDRRLLLHSELHPLFESHLQFGRSPAVIRELQVLIDKSLADQRRNIHIPYLASSLALQAARLVAAGRFGE